MVSVKYFTRGKSSQRNEDFFGHSQTTFVLADGATDKSGRRYRGKTGGEIVARLVVRECLHTSLTGQQLVTRLNKLIAAQYKRLKILKDTRNAMYRLSCSFVCVRIVQDHLVVTILGDSGFRLNGHQVIQHHNEVDRLNANARAMYIKKTSDVPGGRDHILPLLLQQFQYQNNSRHKLGYGVLDGTHTPAKYIQAYRFPLSKLKTFELFSDGYPDLPKKATIASWERLYRHIQRVDPDKYLRYLSTKSKDDRTIAIITFSPKM